MSRRPPPLRHRPGDRGALTLSLALVFPVVLALVFLVVQASLYWYAGQAAQTAAREGADAGRTRGGTPEAGEAQARQFLDRVGSLAEPVSVNPRGGDQNTFVITVAVRPLAVLPGFDRFTITRRVSAPREKFVPQVGQP
ncbi:TadE/TadG family type IV pilus assembly protein [Kitasatospora sp. NPDC002040]|uniref:TadE/TadG family type IV pilus assembly protein n=1 Tax=Kitasatospora sp. NPDC002040 TaxID=3154661 RepID=UPI00333204DB